MPLTGLRCCLQDFWIKAAWLFRNSRANTKTRRTQGARSLALLQIVQDVYAVQVGDNKILDRDHTQLRLWAADSSRRAVTFEFTAGDLDSDDDGEEDDYTVERILTDKPDRATLGERLYKVHWKGFAASRDSWEPPSSSVPRYTTGWLDYLKKRGISLDVKDGFVQFDYAATGLSHSPFTLDTIVFFAKYAAGMHIPWPNTSPVPPIPIWLT